ncbi:MAG: mandelate racemase/muconate lactonizing enzyme family protein [Candidatus Latescibacteria bacterium]|jgi:galactonate dehydratase|nr:mandelate racemase/muconate lactonizing enzyme family protein [Candidatus Latescibacterota bacterium]
MKITDLKTFVVGNPWKNWIFLKLYTDEGLVGLGEATGGLASKPNLGDLEELKRLVIGEDPRQPDYLWQKMYKSRFANYSTGMSGIEMACYDILGRSLNVPVWQLLGGKQRDQLRVYANGWYQGPREPQFFAEEAAKLVARGYTAMKFDPFGGAHRQIDRQSERLSIEIVRAVRKAVGDDVDLCIEAHDRFTVSHAIRIGRALEEFSPMWLETPVHSSDVAATVEVAKAIDVPVAVGERYKRMGPFVDLLATKVVDIIQPEVLSLGVSNLKRVCGIAEASEALVACHQAQSPLCTVVNAHMHASVSNFLIQENFDDSLEPWTWDLLSGVPRVQDGYLKVPDAPGWGVELNEAEAEKHPYGEKNFLRLFQEGWETRKPE